MHLLPGGAVLLLGQVRLRVRVAELLRHHQEERGQGQGRTNKPAPGTGRCNYVARSTWLKKKQTNKKKRWVGGAECVSDVLAPKTDRSVRWSFWLEFFFFFFFFWVKKGQFFFFHPHKCGLEQTKLASLATKKLMLSHLFFFSSSYWPLLDHFLALFS